MLIQITDPDAKGKRSLIVTDETGELFNQPIDDVKHGHKLGNIGLKHGWDSEELAVAVKADTAHANAAIDKGRADAKPKTALKPKK